MWPWEHLLFGYLVYWPVGRATNALRDRPVLVLAVATQFPDLVDKPLAWGLHVLPNGLSVGHSILVAVPLSVVVVALTRRAGDTTSGVAFGVGYGSHLLGDVLYSSLMEGHVTWRFLLWPLVRGPTVRRSFDDILVSLLTGFAGFLTTPTGLVYLGAEVTLVLVAVLRWRADGYPGLGYVRRVLAAV